VAQHDAGRALGVVLIDDRPERRRLLRQILLGSGLALGDVGEADDKAKALALVDPRGEDLAVLEMRPVDDGLVMIAELRRRAPRARIVACSFGIDAEIRRRALEAGADACLDKPVRAADFRKLVDDLYPDGLPQAAAAAEADVPPEADEPTPPTSWSPSDPEEMPAPAGIAGGGPAGLTGA
jgi:two-component system sensor histidine kinase RpfC